MRPSDYVRRQMRFTPYPTEDVGWIIEQAGPEVCLFSSDYPHVEGGRRPVERFEASLGDADERVRDAFYRDNFLDLMGSAGVALARLGRSPRRDLGRMAHGRRRTGNLKFRGRRSLLCPRWSACKRDPGLSLTSRGLDASGPDFFPEDVEKPAPARDP